MVTRDELKTLIDELPESRFEFVHTILDHHLHPRQLSPELERLRQKSQEYKRRAMERFRESRVAGGAGMGTGGGTNYSEMHEGRPFGRTSYHSWDAGALVYQTLQSFDGQEIEMIERLTVSADRTKLQCVLEIASEGRTVRHEDEFPFKPTT